VVLSAVTHRKKERATMKTFKRFTNAWHGLIGCVYLAVVIGILSAAKSQFETLVLAILIQVYAALLYNFSVIGACSDVNNYAGFVRFRILAKAQGVEENEDGLFSEQEGQLRDTLARSKTAIIINQFSHGVVSIYALYKIIMAVLG
jgi:Na+/melibiose symporter-like transporter